MYYDLAINLKIMIQLCYCQIIIIKTNKLPIFNRGLVYLLLNYLGSNMN